MCNLWNTLRFHVSLLPTNRFTIFSLRGKKNPATGPTKKRQMTVPMPMTPPVSQPQRRKKASTAMRMTENLRFVLFAYHYSDKVVGPCAGIGLDDDRHSACQDDAAKHIAYYPCCHAALGSDECAEQHIERIDDRASAEHADECAYLDV